MEKDNQLFQKMLDAIVPTILEGTKGGGGRWPMPFFETSFFVGYYDSALIAENFLRITDILLEQGKSICDIAQLYKYPSRIARFSHIFPGRGLWNIDIERQKVFAFRVAEMLNCLYKKNSFNQDSKNFIYTDQEVKNFILDSQFSSTDSFLSVKKISNLLWLVAESYSPRFPNIFFEFSGEYELDGRYFVIKDYHNLRPEYLTFEIPYNFENIKIIEVYSEPVDYKVDMMCRSLASNQNMPNPESLLMIVDGKIITSSMRIGQMAQDLLLALEKSTKHLNLLSKDQIIIWNTMIDLYAFIFPLIGRDCFDLLSKDYLDEIKSEEFTKRYNKTVDWFKSVPKDVTGWGKIFDPRHFL